MGQRDPRADKNRAIHIEKQIILKNQYIKTIHHQLIVHK